LPDDLLHQVREVVEAVLKHGVRPARLLEIPALLQLACVRQRTTGEASPLALAFAAEGVLREAADALGGGPYGQAARLLLGLDEESRGLPLKTRRRLAADELDVLPSTFRKLYEDAVLQDVAAELLRH